STWSRPATSRTPSRGSSRIRPGTSPASSSRSTPVPPTSGNAAALVHPAILARRFADRPAVVMGSSGETVTFAELEDRSLRLSQLFRSRRVERGDVVAVFLENNARFLEVVWAAHRSGLYYTTINSHLTASEAGYIVRDCGARVLVSSSTLAPVVAAMDVDVEHRLMIDGAVPGWEPYETAIAAHPARPIADEGIGDFMLYSS